jgi:hypothetical protein
MSFLDRKLDGEASEMIFWICKQIEGAVMRSKNVADEQKTETLTLGLGREKRSEEILRYSRRDAMTIVGDDKRPSPMPLPVREGSRMICGLIIGRYGDYSPLPLERGWG